MKSVNDLKQLVAQYVSTLINNQNLVLLGSGTTVNQIIKESQITTKFTSASRFTSQILRENNRQEISLDTVISEEQKICVDGADEILEDGEIIIKGHGGALVREKITWQEATEILVAVDESKISTKLSKKIPVVILQFGSEAIKKTIEQIEGVKKAELVFKDNLPYNTDDGLVQLNLEVESDTDLIGLHEELQSTSGVIDMGIFLRHNYDKIQIICATQDGIKTL